MAQISLMPNASIATVGASFFVGTAVDRATVQFTPQTNLGYSGTVVIDSSTAPSPGANDWFPIMTLVFSAHTSSVSLDVFLNNNPWLRARVVSPTLGSVSVYLAY